MRVFTDVQVQIDEKKKFKSEQRRFKEREITDLRQKQIESDLEDKQKRDKEIGKKLTYKQTLDDQIK